MLNGIAYDAKDDRLFVTGKNWPKLFEIRLRKAGELAHDQSLAAARSSPPKVNLKALS